MTPDQDGRLHELLSEAVADVEPREGLTAIRARTDTRGRPRQVERPWTLVLAGALAVGCVIAAVAGLGQVVGDRAGPAALPSDRPGPTGALLEPGGEDQSSGPDGGASIALPIYYLVDTERAGVRLVREFRSGDPDRRLDDALRLLEGDPLDPDYRTAWPLGSFAGAGFDGIGRDGNFSVVLADPSLQERPTGMSRQEAERAVQQVVWTLQGLGQVRSPVTFYVDREPVDTVLGVPTGTAVTNGSTLEVLNLLNITTPEQGQSVTEKLRFTGVANSFEASVYWEIRQGTDVVASGPATAGWQGDRLYPFEEEIDVRDLEPGDYTIWATTDDPTGGTEGAGAMTDSKEFTIP